MFKRLFPNLVAFWLCLFAQNKINSIYTDIDVIIYLDNDIQTFLAISFDLVNYITKNNVNSYPNYNGKVEGGLSPERLNIVISKMYFYGVFKIY